MPVLLSCKCASRADEAVLTRLGQRSLVIIDEGGTAATTSPLPNASMARSPRRVLMHNVRVADNYKRAEELRGARFSA